MTTRTALQLHIGQALPHGDANDSAAIVALWKEIQGFLAGRDCVARGTITGKAQTWQVALDASALIALMEKALAESQSFSDHLQAHIADPHKALDATLHISVTSAGQAADESESYQVATIFLQQLVLAGSIILPGSIQILDARFLGPGAHRYEAQQFDSRILHGARLSARANSWPVLRQPDLASVWAWLDRCGTSEVHTAIKSVNKVLFTLLKVAEQRHEYSARTVLLVTYQLEMLLDSRNSPSPMHIRHRAHMVLGRVPEAADCFGELYEVRNSLFVADQPVHRPPLICHNTAEALREQIGQHNTAVEAGTALVLALLQDLLAHDATAYEFSETFTRTKS